MIYNNIFDPKNNVNISIFSTKGKKLLKMYLKQFLIG